MCACPSDRLLTDSAELAIELSVLPLIQIPEVVNHIKVLWKDDGTLLLIVVL